MVGIDTLPEGTSKNGLANANVIMADLWWQLLDYRMACCQAKIKLSNYHLTSWQDD